MDDNKFDDLLKGKLKNYEDPTFDASALEGLHERLGSFQPTPWHGRNGVRNVFIASLFLLTAINTYFFIHNSVEQNNPVALLEPVISYANTMDSLNLIIEHLQKELTQQKEIRPLPVSLTSPKFQFHLVQENESNGLSALDLVYKLDVGGKKNIPQPVYERLKDEGLLTEDHGELFLLLHKKSTRPVQFAIHVSPTDLMVPTPLPPTMKLFTMNTEKAQPRKTIKIIPQGKSSLAAKNALEKHYFNKLGIQIAPHLDLVKGIFARGDGGITPRVGLTADWLITPRISFESGIDYTTTQNLLNHNDIPPYVQYNPQLGSCETATLTSRLISIPLNIKYRRWISEKRQFVLRAGYTPYILLSKQSQYNYVRPDVYGTSETDRTTTFNNYREFRFFGSTLSTSAGLTIKRNKNKGIWEAALFYEHGLGQGFDQKSMQLIGLRTAFWFKVR